MKEPVSEHRDTIVCATDFSDTSNHALAWAAAVSRRWNADIELIHALAPPFESLEALVTDVRVMDHAAHTAAAHRLEQVARDAEASLGVPIRARVLAGDAPAVICRIAAETEARMIVLGSHGRSAVGRWIMGSVADRTVRAADRPVAVVPPAGDTRDDVVPSMRDPERRLRILAGIDLESAGARIVAFVADFKRRQPCDVTFLHLYWPPEQFERLGLHGPREMLETDPDVAANLAPQLRQSIGLMATDPTVQLAIRPAWGQPAASLLVAAQESGADLLVVGAEERHGLSAFAHPSVAASLVRQARHVPVICLPAQRGTATTSAPVENPVLLTILAPTDLSVAGNHAVRYAYAMLEGRPGVVEICYVHEHALADPPYAYDDVRGRLPPERRAAIEQELRALVPPNAEGSGIKTHVSVIDGGVAAKAIVQAVERLNVDAVSIGSHGRGDIARVLLGSVAEEVVRHSPKPVLVVRAAH